MTDSSDLARRSRRPAHARLCAPCACRPGYFAPDSLSFQTSSNQQFRVDIIDPASTLFTLDVLQSVLLVGPGNPHTFGYETQTTSLASTTPGWTPREAIRSGDHPVYGRSGECFFRRHVTLTWATDNATSVEIDNGISAVPLSGSRAVED